MEQLQQGKPNLEFRIPVLITSSITPHDAGVKLLDPKQRLFHAIEAIEQWTRVAPELRLVLCDGSGFDFGPIVKERFPDAMIECLYFENDQEKIALYGRGYGEGEIVRFALKHSIYLRETDVFAKCSSKLWVENYAECFKEWRKDCLFPGVFINIFSILKPTNLIQVDTRFYIVDSDFYARHLIDAHHKIRPGFGLEDTFYQALSKIQKQAYLFKNPPAIRGVGGGIGKYYKATCLRIIKDKLGLKIIKNSKKFNIFFD